jgi:hypothetical protein
MRKVFWTLSALSAALGGIVLVFGVASANGAPQEAAFAAIAIGLAVIPYCFNRALDEFDRPPLPKTSVTGAPAKVRCNQCSTIFVANAKSCPGCGGHVLDSVPV